MERLRNTDDAKGVLSLIEPLSEVDASKIRTDMYAIPATQMLHKCMYHETSRAKKEDIEDDEDDVYGDEQQKLVYNRSNNSSVLKYIATNKITSSLGN